MAKISGKQLLLKEVERWKYIAGARDRELAKVKEVLKARDIQLETSEGVIAALCTKFGQGEVEITKAEILDAMSSETIVKPDFETGSFVIIVNKGEQKCE